MVVTMESFVHGVLKYSVNALKFVTCGQMSPWSCPVLAVTSVYLYLSEQKGEVGGCTREGAHS